MENQLLTKEVGFAQGELEEDMEVNLADKCTYSNKIEGLPGDLVYLL